MKKLKFIIIALIVLALLIGAYFLVTALTKEEEPVTDNTPEVITVYDETNDDIISINYQNTLGEASYVKHADVWYYSVDREAPIDQTFVQTMADSLIKVTASRDITDEGDESAYGFDSPTLSYTVGTKGAKTITVTVGAYNSVSQSYYLKYNDRIYIVDSTVTDATGYSLFDSFVRTDLPEIEAEKITSLTVNGEAGDPAGYANLGITAIEDYKNKENYGFDGSENVVVVTYTESTDVTDENGNVTSTVDTEKTYTFSYVTSEAITYFMLPEDNNIYTGTGTEALK